MELLPMTDYVLNVLNEDRPCDRGAMLEEIGGYAELLKTPLELGMFAPVDDNGNILQGAPLSPAKDSEWTRWENEMEDFYNAREKVLFKNFQIQNTPDWIKFYNGIRVFEWDENKGIFNLFSHVFRNNGKLKNVEYMTKYKVDLNKSAIEYWNKSKTT